MRQTMQSTRRWAFAPLAVLFIFAVLVTPAAAKGPLLYPYACYQPGGKASASAETRALCERRATPARQQAGLGASQTTSGGFGWAAASVLAALVVVVAGGLLVATRRRGADDPRPVAQPS